MLSVSESLKLCVQRQPTNEANPPYFVPLIPFDILPPHISVPGLPRCIPADAVGVGPGKWTCVGSAPLEDVSTPPNCEGVDNKAGNGNGLGIQQEYSLLYPTATERMKSDWQRRKLAVDHRDDALSLSSLHTQDGLEYDLKGSKASLSLSSPASSHEELSNHHAISPVRDSKHLGCSSNSSKSPDNTTPIFFHMKNTSKCDHGEGSDGHSGNYSDDELLTLSQLSRQGQLYRNRHNSTWQPELPESLVPTTIGLQLSSASSVASGSDVSASTGGHVGTEGGVPLCPHTRLQPPAPEATAWVSPTVNNEKHAPPPSRTGLDSSTQYTGTKLNFFSSIHARSGFPARRGPSLTPALAKDTSLAQTFSRNNKKRTKEVYCRSWCQIGDCKYGLKCIYKHDMPESEADLKTVGLKKVPTWYFLMNSLPRTESQGHEGYEVAGREQQQQGQHAQYLANSPVQYVHLPRQAYPGAENGEAISKQFNDNSTTPTSTSSNSSIDNDYNANSSQRQRQRQRQGYRLKPKPKQDKTSDYVERARIELDAILEKLTSKSRAEEDRAEEDKKQKQCYVGSGAKEENTEASTLIDQAVGGEVATSSLAKFSNGSSRHQPESSSNVLINI